MNEAESGQCYSLIPLFSGLSPVAFHQWPFTSGLSPGAFDQWPFTSGLSPVAFDQWPFTSGLWSVAFDQWPFTSGLSPVAFHQWPFVFKTRHLRDTRTASWWQFENLRVILLVINKRKLIIIRVIGCLRNSIWNVTNPLVIHNKHSIILSSKSLIPYNHI